MGRVHGERERDGFLSPSSRTRRGLNFSRLDFAGTQLVQYVSPNREIPCGELRIESPLLSLIIYMIGEQK